MDKIAISIYVCIKVYTLASTKCSGHRKRGKQLNTSLLVAEQIRQKHEKQFASSEWTWEAIQNEDQK